MNFGGKLIFIYFPPLQSQLSCYERILENVHYPMLQESSIGNIYDEILIISLKEIGNPASIADYQRPC